jgi:hypothetical protein
MQGTGAIVMAGLFNAVKVAGTRWRDQRVIVFGRGTAGIGIAGQIRDHQHPYVRAATEVADWATTPVQVDPNVATRKAGNLVQAVQDAIWQPAYPDWVS